MICQNISDAFQIAKNVRKNACVALPCMRFFCQHYVFLNGFFMVFFVGKRHYIAISAAMTLSVQLSKLSGFLS